MYQVCQAVIIRNGNKEVHCDRVLSEYRNIHEAIRRIPKQPYLYYVRDNDAVVASMEIKHINKYRTPLVVDKWDNSWIKVKKYSNFA